MLPHRACCIHPNIRAHNGNGEQQQRQTAGAGPQTFLPRALPAPPACSPGSGGRFDRGDGYGRRRYDDRGPPPPRRAWPDACRGAVGTKVPEGAHTDTCRTATPHNCPCICAPQGAADLCRVCARPAAAHPARPGALQPDPTYRLATPRSLLSQPPAMEGVHAPCRGQLCRAPALGLMCVCMAGGHPSLWARFRPSYPPAHTRTNTAGHGRLPMLHGRLVGRRHQGGV